MRIVGERVQRLEAEQIKTMMTQYELLSLVFVIGVSIPVALFGVYWLAVDSAKRYTNKKIREAKF